MLYQVSYCCSAERTEQLGQILTDLSKNYWKACENVWVVESERPATELRDLIRPHLSDSEAVIVALLAGHASWHGFDRRSEDWLLAHL